MLVSLSNTFTAEQQNKNDNNNEVLSEYYDQMLKTLNDKNNDELKTDSG